MSESAGLSGIKLHGIYLDELEYRIDVEDQSIAPSKYIEIEIGVQFRNDDPNGYARLTIDCHHPEDEPNGHSLHVRLVGIYEKVADEPSIPFDKFLCINAPASLFAFAREVVYSVTSRSYLPTIFLDPINMHDVIKAGRISYRQELNPKTNELSDEEGVPSA